MGEREDSWGRIYGGGGVDWTEMEEGQERGGGEGWGCLEEVEPCGVKVLEKGRRKSN